MGVCVCFWRVKEFKLSFKPEGGGLRGGAGGVGALSRTLVFLWTSAGQKVPGQERGPLFLFLDMRSGQVELNRPLTKEFGLQPHP